MRTARRSWGDRLLTVTASLGVLCILLVPAAALSGTAALVFRSGSMAPAFDTGDLAVARDVPAGQVRPGDVVSVVTSTGSRVTHRVVSVTADGDSRRLVLKGDANRAADAEVYTVTRARKVLFRVPWAGYLVSAASSRTGVFALGLYVAVMGALVLRRTPRGARHRSGGRSLTMIATTTAATTAAVLGPAAPALAVPWTDTVAVSGATLATATIPAPTVTCGTASLGSIRLNWTAVTGATGYVLHHGTGGATTENVGAGTTSKTFSGLATSGTFTVEAQTAYGSTTWTSVTSNARTYSVLLFVLGSCS